MIFAAHMPKFVIGVRRNDETRYTRQLYEQETKHGHQEPTLRETPNAISAQGYPNQGK
jgi:hypothetical protein